MGAGGVIVPPATYFEKIQAVLKKHDVLLIADEVICGFGRTGNMFGSETFGMQPDIITMAKALSSAYLPISATMITETIYQALRRQERQDRHLRPRLHLFRPSGLLRRRARDAEDLRGARHPRPCAQRGAALPGRAAARFADHPLVGEVRGVGLIAAIELVRDKKTQGSPSTAKPGVGALLAARAPGARPDRARARRHRSPSARR